MNPTLSAPLALLPAHIEWHPGDTHRQAFAHLATPNNFIAIDLQMSARPSYRLSVSLSRYERPTVRVSVDDRPDIRSAWTEVADVVARVDAAAGAAMAGTQPATPTPDPGS